MNNRLCVTTLFLLASLIITDVIAEDRISHEIAETLLLYQRDNGGWPKNYDWETTLDNQKRKELLNQKHRNDTTIDNGATHKEIRYLAKAYVTSKDERYRRAALQGIQFLLRAQYDNGGWPQYCPEARGYHKHITFNDGAMIGVMSLFRDIKRGDPEFGFVDERTRQMAADAIAKGLDCILKCQIVVNGQKTVWCAQHDEQTLVPRPARSYELVSLSGGESVKIVTYLMAIENPSSTVVEAIDSAIAWFEKAKILGKRVTTVSAPSSPKGTDRIVVADPSADPLWARFYEIDTNRPFFCSRDGIPKYQLSEISYERRNGYSWLGTYADSLLTTHYPAWQKRQALGTISN